MTHSFDIDIAKEYGINQAILLNNIYFWIEKNRANNNHFYDGTYWTYNSSRAFSKIFPYLSSKQIEYSLKKLINEGLIITGNYNKIPYDRTLWYAITEKGNSILQNCQMEVQKLSNEIPQIVEPIPYINTDNKTDNNICPSKDERDSISSLETELSNNFDKIWKEYPRKEGKDTAFKHYKKWIKGKKFAGKTVKLENKEMWYAVKIYNYLIKENSTDKQYIKMGSTFFNEAIMEYANKYIGNKEEWERKV